MRWQPPDEQLECRPVIFDAASEVAGDHRELVEVGVERSRRHAESCIAPGHTAKIATTAEGCPCTVCNVFRPDSASPAPASSFDRLAQRRDLSLNLRLNAFQV